MLDSVKIQRRQSEIRTSLSELVGKDKPTEDETRSMADLDTEYRNNETRYRAALIAEDNERREAGEELEQRSDKEYSELVDNFELRQVTLFLDEGRALDGQTAEVVQELRSGGGYQGVPVPYEALEVRNTVAAGTPDPVRTAPIIDRLFPNSVAARMGVQMVDIGVGELEYPVTTSAVTAGWATTETADVPGPTPYTTADQPLKPDHTLGINMEITRKAMKQSGAALEQAVRRDMNGAIAQAMDAAIFQGTGAAGEPTGIIPGAAGYGITETPVDAAASYAVFLEALVRFMTRNAANSGADVNLLIRPELMGSMDAALLTGTAVSEFDRLLAKIGNVVMSNNALTAPAGSPLASNAVMTTRAGGVSPIFCGKWGAVDLIRDPYTKAKSGALLITALATMDVTVSRGTQTEILTGLEE